MPHVAVANIRVPEGRFREDFGDVEELADSIKRLGLLHPLIIDKDCSLIAGERRLRAVRLLGWSEVDVKQFEELNDLQKREIELEENIKRKQFTWQEEVKAKKEIDSIKRQLYGSAVKGHESEGWGIADTAKALEQSPATVSMDIQLAKALESFPELAEERTKSKAYRKLLRLQERAIRAELARRSVTPADANVVIHGDCVRVMENMPELSVDLIVTDPPWGIDVRKVSMLNKHQFEGEVFEDEEGISLDVLAAAFKQMFRVLRNDRHGYVFFAISLYAETLARLEEAGFEVDNVPLIWNKKSGSHPSMGQNYANCYEPIFHVRKGRRDLATPGQNMLTYDRVPAQLKIHPTEKPTTLLSFLIEQSSSAGEVVLDPFAGSGATLEAAYLLRRVPKGIELDEKMCNLVKERIRRLA